MLFGNLAKNSKKNRLYLGAPEAEAEATKNSKVVLTDVYEDWHDLFTLLEHEKFIVVGRKGAGKSAFARYTQDMSKDEANLFVEFIKQNKANLEKLVQIGQDRGHPVEKEAIFKWLVFTHLIQLFCQNEAVQQDKNFNELKNFVRRNSGFININELEKKEFTKNQTLEVNVEPLKRFYKQKVKKDFTIKSQRAPFYKLLPHLEEVVIAVLKSSFEIINKNNFVLFFDDLDVGFDTTNKDTVDNIVALLRVTRDINNEVFNDIPGRAKVVILIRDDVEKYISDNYEDTAKILASYSAPIDWYQDDYNINDSESELNIKKFIDLRIRNAFKKAQLPCLSNPWDSLVDKQENYAQKTSFKYILDHTLFRPRDLLLLFSFLETGNYQIPLDKKSVINLISKYSSLLVKELRNELVSFYSQQEINQIIGFLKILNNKPSYSSYDEAVSELTKEYRGPKKIDDVLSDLFNRSVIGACSANNNYKFKYREPVNECYSLEDRDSILLHYGFRPHFNKTQK